MLPLDEDDSIMEKSQEAFTTQDRRRNKFAFGTNRYTEQINDLRSFQSKNLQHMIVKAPAVKKSITTSFDRFFLLSVLPEDIIKVSTDYLSRKKYTDPFICRFANVIDQYPFATSADLKSNLSPEAVSSFCLPLGVKLRLIPRCAFEGKFD